MYQLNPVSIFTNKEIVAEVESAHYECKKKYKGLTLRECFLAGHTWNEDKIEKIKEKLATFMWKGTERTLDFSRLERFFLRWNHRQFPDFIDKFGVYNGNEKMTAKPKAKFLQEEKDNKCFEETKDVVSLSNLENLSLRGISQPATVVLPIKMYIIANYKKEHHHDYFGILPNSGPTKSAIKHLFGKGISTQYRQTLLCQSLARDTGKSPLFINTALWLLGQ